MSKASALSTLGKVKPATRSIAEEIWDAMHKAGFTVTRMWGMGPGDEHGVGRAIDVMTTGSVGGKRAGDWLFAFLWANRKRLRLKWVIWDEQIRSTSKGKPTTPTPYRGKNPHTDHVHLFVADGAYVPPPASGGGGGAGTDDGIPGWWHVDPKRVSTFLWGLKGGDRKNIKAKPGRNIKVVREATKRGKKWLVTEHDNWFAKYYMNRGKS